MFQPTTNYELGELFGLQTKGAIPIIGGAEGTPNAPKIEDHIFTKELTADLLTFWQADLRGLKLIGDPAAGKTSAIRQWHARMRWPLYALACNSQITTDELIGHWVPRDGALVFNYGVVARAAMEGASVLLDEMNALEPNAVLSVHMLLDGYPVYVPQTGETITPAENFRVFATENSLASKLTLAGRHMHDVSTDDRWMQVTVDYLPEEQEIAHIKSVLCAAGMPEPVTEQVAKLLVKVARKTRELYHLENSAITKPMSTRVLKRWAQLTWGYAFVKNSGKDPALYALERAFAGLSHEMWVEVEQIYNGTRGQYANAV